MRVAGEKATESVMRKIWTGLERNVFISHTWIRVSAISEIGGFYHRVVINFLCHGGNVLCLHQYSSTRNT